MNEKRITRFLDYRIVKTEMNKRKTIGTTIKTYKRIRTHTISSIFLTNYLKVMFSL